MKYVRKSCFAYDESRKNGCNALLKANCADCPFYKTKAQTKKERVASLEKIKALSDEKKVKIVDTYTDFWKVYEIFDAEPTECEATV